MAKYLDLDGLARYDAKIKAKMEDLRTEILDLLKDYIKDDLDIPN